MDVVQFMSAVGAFHHQECDIRHKAGQAVSLAATECHTLSSEFGDLQRHMKQPENSSAVMMYGRVEKRM